MLHDMPKPSYDPWFYIEHNDPWNGTHTKGVGDNICLDEVSKLIFSDAAICDTIFQTNNVTDRWTYHDSNQG
jgi:hypothetical protein